MLRIGSSNSETKWKVYKDKRVSRREETRPTIELVVHRAIPTSNFGAEILGRFVVTSQIQLLSR